MRVSANVRTLKEKRSEGESAPIKKGATIQIEIGRYKNIVRKKFYETCKISVTIKITIHIN